MHPNRIILSDRGSLAGLAYWPGPEQDFFTTMHSSLEDELSRYDAVIFLKLPLILLKK